MTPDNEQVPLNNLNVASAANVTVINSAEDDTTTDDQQNDYKASFHVDDEKQIVTVTFTDLVTEKLVFEIGLDKSKLTWELMEDIGFITDGNKPADANPVMALVQFFKKYVIGGVKAVPLEHTQTVFMAIKEYMEVIGTGTAKN